MTVTATLGSVAVRRPRRWSIDRVALVDATPLVAGLAPFALVIGVAAAGSPDGALAGVSGSVLLYAGSAQLSGLSLLGAGASLLTVVLTITLINARLLVYGAGLAPHFAGQPAWFRWGMAHFIVDPSFALVTARNDLDDPARFRRYWLTTNAVILLGWAGMMSIGAALGPVVPDLAAVQFLPVAAFLTMVTPSLAGRPQVVAAVVAASVVAVVPLPSAVRVVVALVVGASAGALVEGRNR